jgi:NAD(P)-dependent dehydrogenase (short-subunit alcohol dehydrogenase family)
VRCSGKVIVVTGGGTGIGAQVARDLCREGGVVYVLGRRSAPLEALERNSESGAGSVRGRVCDVANEEQVELVFARILDEVGPVFGVVNNAGVNPSRNTVVETSPADWNLTISVNLTGAYHCARAAIPQMERAGRGAIVNVASIAALSGLKQRAAYSASKAGLVGLTRSIAVDYASRGIRANCVCPGYVETNLVAPFLKTLTADERGNLVRTHPLGRLGRPEDVSRAVTFLLSEDADWITGAILPVDGGYCVGK